MECKKDYQGHIKNVLRNQIDILFAGEVSRTRPNPHSLIYKCNSKSYTGKTFREKLRADGPTLIIDKLYF